MPLETKYAECNLIYFKVLMSQVLPIFILILLGVNEIFENLLSIYTYSYDFLDSSLFTTPSYYNT